MTTYRIANLGELLSHLTVHTPNWDTQHKLQHAKGGLQKITIDLHTRGRIDTFVAPISIQIAGAITNTAKAGSKPVAAVARRVFLLAHRVGRPSIRKTGRGIC